jgi:dolichol kinase
MKKEVLRKLIHFSSTVYPLLYFFLLEKSQMLILALTDNAITFFFWINNLTTKILNPFLISDEIKGQVLGSNYFMVGTLMAIFLFERNIAIAYILVSVASAALASLLGKGCGRQKLYKEKTLVGFLAFLISTSIIPYFLNPLFIISVFFISFVELFAEKLEIDDNLLILLP